MTDDPPDARPDDPPGVPAPRFDFSAPLPALAELGRVHVIAIGGAGMSAVARLLLERGVAVSGSDAKDSATLEALRHLGARVHVGHDPAYLEGAETVVVSSAVRETNPELAAARARGLRVLHRSQGLAVATEGARVVAVGGANGKTTTSAMLTVALHHAGLDPSFALGGELVSLGTNAHLGSGPDVVVEADESDGSFVVYRPDVAVVTNVQPDHLDHYGTFEAVKEAYAAFVATVPDGGLLVACHDDDGARGAAERTRAEGRVEVRTYGYGGGDVVIADTVASGLGSHSTLYAAGAEHPLDLAVPGRHNVRNATAAWVAACWGCEVPFGAAGAGLAAFDGARRRFELRGEVGGVGVVDDYAHNGPKVAAVVSTAAEIVAARGGRLLVAFQPHLYSRTRDFAEAFAAGLAPADHVVLLDIYGAREEPMAGVSRLIAGPLRALPGERTVQVGLSFEEAARDLAARARPGDLVLTVGAGDVTTVAPLVLAALAERAGAGRSDTREETS